MGARVPKRSFRSACAFSGAGLFFGGHRRLASMGYKGPQVGKGLAPLRKHLDDMKDELPARKPIKIGYQLLAKYPLKAKTAKSVACEYNNPEIPAEAQPVQLTVAKARKADD